MKLRKSVIAPLLAIAVLSAAATPALGVTYRVNHPRDPSYATVRDHHWITVCDQDPDGHKTYVQYTEWGGRVKEPGTPWLTGYDWYGYRSGEYGNPYPNWCLTGSYPAYYPFSTIKDWVVCVQYEGCSGYGKRFP